MRRDCPLNFVLTLFGGYGPIGAGTEATLGNLVPNFSFRDKGGDMLKLTDPPRRCLAWGAHNARCLRRIPPGELGPYCALHYGYQSVTDWALCHARDCYLWIEAGGILRCPDHGGAALWLGGDQEAAEEGLRAVEALARGLRSLLGVTGQRGPGRPRLPDPTQRGQVTAALGARRLAQVDQLAGGPGHRSAWVRQVVLAELERQGLT